MATAYKVLGQQAPSATTLTTLYTVPSSTEAVVSTIFVCNRSTSSRSFRIAVRPSGQSIADKHYQFYDSVIDANASVPITVGMTLSATDVISVYASSGDLSFTAYGSEIS